MTPPVEAAASSAAVQSFEALVALKSARSGEPAFAVGYYVSLRLLFELNARSPPQEQIDKDALQKIVQVPGNARMFKRSSFAVHESVDDLVLNEIGAYAPTKLERSELTRLQQVTKRANHPKFCEKIKEIAPKGDKLLSRLHQALASALRRYTGGANCAGATEIAAGADGALGVSVNQHSTFTPVPTASLHTGLNKTSSRSPPRPSHPLFPVLQVCNATVDSIHRETSVIRAYEVFQKYPLRFTAYRVFFKNDRTKLATDISRCCMDKFTKTEIRKWIRANIGSIPAYNAKATSGHEQASSRSRPSAFFNWELRHLALVAAALTVYGEHVISALYDAHAMKSLKDIPLVSDEVRDASKQKLCLRRARVHHNGLHTSGAYHAAHYLPLDLTIQWNNALPPELRLSAKDLSAILNLQCNMKAVRKRVNIKDHRKVEHFIAAFIKQSTGGGGSCVTPKCASWLVWRNTKDRLEQIARRVQSKELRTALFRANGHELYALIGRTFQQIEDEFAQRGYDFGRIWVQQQGKVDDEARPLLCELLR